MLCIEGKLTASAIVAAMTATVSHASISAEDGIKAAMHCKTVEADITTHGVFEATMTAVCTKANFSYSCPINYIESCFSLGGWDDDICWNDNRGWKD